MTTRKTNSIQQSSAVSCRTGDVAVGGLVQSPPGPAEPPQQGHQERGQDRAQLISFVALAPLSAVLRVQWLSTANHGTAAWLAAGKKCGFSVSLKEVQMEDYGAASLYRILTER